MEIKGHGGTYVTFDGTVVSIARKGFLARSTVGKGEKRIPVHHITAVQFKPAGPVMNGFIQFTVGGGTERRSRFGSQTTDASRDENSVIFTKAQQPEFERLRGEIEHAMAYGGQQYAPQPQRQYAPEPQRQYAPQPQRQYAPEPQRSTAPEDPVAKLSELAQLHRQGALTDQEFDQAKRQLLGGSHHRA